MNGGYFPPPSPLANIPYVAECNKFKRVIEGLLYFSFLFFPLYLFNISLGRS